MSMLGRFVRLDVREVGATAETAVASLLPSSGFWPASPNWSRCLTWRKRKSCEWQNNENEGGKKTAQSKISVASEETHVQHLFTRAAGRKMEVGPHLASICFTVPVIWCIFSSKREMVSLFCLELASELCRGNVRMFVTKRWRYPFENAPLQSTTVSLGVQHNGSVAASPATCGAAVG